MPPYRQIAAIIKRGILSGQYPPDTRIPTESELVETYEVARSTARRAVAALREEGLVYTVPARGTYVARLDGRTNAAFHKSDSAQLPWSGLRHVMPALLVLTCDDAASAGRRSQLVLSRASWRITVSRFVIAL